MREKPTHVEPPETWLDLEKLATGIYSELSPDCTVEHNVRVRGKESGGARQIDVLIRDPQARTLAVVDCKDWARKVGVEDAYSFAGLLADVEATSGVMICNRGFTKGARRVAHSRGFNLCQLHDVASRKWQLDVMVPIVWTTVQVSDLRVSFTARLEAGDQLERNTPPKFTENGQEVDPIAEFQDDWNAGKIARRPGSYRWDRKCHLVTVGGAHRDAHVYVDCVVGGRSKLGYVTPVQSRGILEVETEAYFSASLDLAKTVEQQPEGGWSDIPNPDELAISIRGTVVVMNDIGGITATWLGLDAMVRIGD